MYPEYVEVEGKKYKINTDFRVAIECNRIAEDDTIGNLERALGIIYTLFGDEGINTPDHYEKLLELAQKYLVCGNELDNNVNDKPDMDFIEDYGLIWASFMSDYNGLDLDKTKMHWWKFMDLMNGLSNSEMGNCCVLNRIRNLRTFDVSEIKDKKERDKILKAKKQVELKKYKNRNKKKATEKEKQSAMNFLNKLRKE